MAKKIEVTGEVTKVNRTVNKNMATVTVMVPSEVAGKLPMGQVNITIEPSQGEMFGE